MKTVFFFYFISIILCYKEWDPEIFLTGKFENNLGSYCKLHAKNGFIKGTYYTKPSRGELIKPGFPITGVYTEVKDGALVTFNALFKMKGENEDGLEKFSIVTWNGKVYKNKNDFSLKWLNTLNQIDEKEWSSTIVGQDTFVKK